LLHYAEPSVALVIGGESQSADAEIPTFKDVPFGNRNYYRVEIDDTGWQYHLQHGQMHNNLKCPHEGKVPSHRAGKEQICKNNKPKQPFQKGLQPFSDVNYQMRIPTLYLRWHLVPERVVIWTYF
jgi:hypothetical protein